MTEIQRVADSPLDPVIYRLHHLGEDRKLFIIYFHPSYLRRIQKEIQMATVYNIGFQGPQQRIMGVEYIVSDWVPEFPGWFVLPSPTPPDEEIGDG